MKEIIKNLETSAVDQRFQIIYQTILSYCLKSRKKKKLKVKTQSLKMQKMEE